MALVPYESRVGFTFPGAFAAVATGCYFAKYGAAHEDLLNITIKSHNNARLNSKAQLPFSIRDIIRAKVDGLVKCSRSKLANPEE